MVANTPGILPKTALVASRAVYYPFTIPQKLTDSSYDVGKAGAGLVEGINTAVNNAYVSLKPRGPAKWLLPLFAKVDAAAKNNIVIADRNKTVFWDPVSQGSESIGRALAGPGAYWYLRKAGVEQPTTDLIKGVLNMPLFSFPVPAPAPPAGGDPAADNAAAAEAAAQSGAGQAAEGAGQAGPPATEQQPAADQPAADQPAADQPAA